MDGTDFLNDAPPILKGFRLRQASNANLTNEPFGVAPPVHSRC